MGEPAARARPRRGEEVVVDVAGLDARGSGVAGVRGHALHLRGALPGQQVRARVLRRRRGRLEGRVTGTVRESPDAVPAPCPHARLCGGCSFQDLGYEAQLRHLREAVAAALRAAGIGAAVPAVVGCRPPFRYRNKMDFTFGSRRFVPEEEPPGAPRDFALGLHVPRRWDKVLDVRQCEIQFPEGDALVASAREIALELALPPWDVRQHTGLLRHLVLRKGVRTGEVMVNLVTSEEAPEKTAPWAAEMLARHPEITTLVHTVNPRPAAVATGECVRVVRGSGMITERVLDLEFVISPNSFFQTNTTQADELLRCVRALAAVGAGGVVWDLFCGTGALTLAVAGDAAEVIGLEVVPDAVQDARRNAARNGITNACFIRGDAAAWIRPAGDRGLPLPEVCVVDPPRAGLHPGVLGALAALRPRRIVWVSCNVGVAAPQVTRLLDAGGYRVTAVQPIDMFPHTPHVEVVFALDRDG